jgi:hypothetical protein
VVKKFEEGKSNKVRIWKGIGLQKSVPPSRPSEKVSRDKSPANVGVVKDNGTLSEDFQNFSTESPTREYFSENDKKVSLDEKSVPGSVTTPFRWTEDGVEWEYLPDEESE